MQQTNPMRMERRRLADLIPAAYNPRKALTPEDPEYQDIKASIQGLGYADPIVINYDGTIIKGHQRRTVMMDMGIEISIHALREEGDRWSTTPTLLRWHFYPRPPRGGRQQKQRQNLYFQTNYTTFCTNLEEP